MIGTPRGAQIRTTSWISAVSCAITTASGGCGASHVVVCACWSRTAWDVIRRLPNLAASASIVFLSAVGSGCFKLFAAIPTQILRMIDRDKGYIAGQVTIGVD